MKFLGKIPYKRTDQSAKTPVTKTIQNKEKETKKSDKKDHNLILNKMKEISHQTDIENKMSLESNDSSSNEYFQSTTSESDEIVKSYTLAPSGLKICKLENHR